MQIDSGAVCSIIPVKVFNKIKLIKNVKVEKTNKKLQSYTKHKLVVKGYVYMQTTYKHKTVDIKFYILDTDQSPLLSGEASQK